jgi:hypothetical protein
MANTIAAFGALDFMHQGGSQRTEELRQVWINSTDVTPIFYGDIVQAAVLVSTATANQGFGPYVTQGCSAVTTGGAGFASAGLWNGVFRGCELFNLTLNKMYYSRYFPGSVLAGTSSLTGDIKAYIVNDLSMRFIIQVSTQGNQVFGSSNIGMVANPAITGTVSGVSSTVGNTATGNSGMSLSSATAITSTSTIAFAFRIVDFYSNWGPGLLPGTVPGLGTGQFVNGMDNTTNGQYVIVQPNPGSWLT